MTQDAFSLSAEWPTASDAVPQTHDVAHIRLSANDQLLTKLVDFERKEERDYVRGSAVLLAFWFADNWWRLRHESLPDDAPPTADWRLRHELTSASGGTLWPPVMIHSTGERLLLTPAYGGAVDLGPVRYELPPVISVGGAAFEAGLDQFFEDVLGACTKFADSAALRAVIAAVKSERADPDMAAWRRLEARLGYDPDTVPDGVMKTLGGLEKKVGQDVLAEAASATPGDGAGETLARTVKAVNDSEIVVDLALANDIPRARIRDAAAAPWTLGREAAYQLRQAQGLRDGPIYAKAFADLFKARSEDLSKPGAARGLPYSGRGRVRTKGDFQRVALQAANARDRRFELACVLGDQIWANSDFGVVTRAKTDRQKFQRAFAQNLLAPYSDVRDHIDPTGPTQLQMEQAAKHFHVHPNVIRRLLVLEGVLPKETFEQRVEAA